MPSISQLVADRETATIDVRGLSIEVTYYPNKITMRRMSELAKRASADDTEAIAELVTEMLDSWDLEGPLDTDDGDELVADGVTIPVEYEYLVALPAMFLIDLSAKLQGLVTDGPNPTKATRPSRKR